MNIEIVKELARQWRRASEPETLARDINVGMVDEQQYDAAHIKESMLEVKIVEAKQATLKQCAKDLEDVIQIFHEFKYPKRVHGREEVGDRSYTAPNIKITGTK